MGKKRVACIILALILCISFVTPALANEDDVGCVVLRVNDSQGVLVITLGIEDAEGEAHGLTDAQLCVPGGVYAYIAIVLEAGYKIERWDISDERINLQDPLITINEPTTEVSGPGVMIIYTTWFMMPSPAIDFEVVAIVSQYESQQLIPQVPQTPGTPQAVPTRPAEEIPVFVDGNRLQLEVPPYLLEGRTLVPLRAIFEALGVDVVWDPEYQTIHAQMEDITVILMIGSNIMFRNGVSYVIDVAPVIVGGGRTLVPTRLIAESFGATVYWNAETRTVDITSD